MEMYCPQITSWSPQEMRVLRQCTVSRAEVMFVNIQLENIRPSKKLTRLLQCLNCPMFAVRLWITTSSYHWPVGSLPSTFMLCTPPALRRDQLVIWDCSFIFVRSICICTRQGTSSSLPLWEPQISQHWTNWPIFMWRFMSYDVIPYLYFQLAVSNTCWKVHDRLFLKCCGDICEVTTQLPWIGVIDIRASALQVTSAKPVLTLWSRISSKWYLRLQSVPQREHNTSPLQRSTG
jgi:hypothetical protein